MSGLIEEPQRVVEALARIPGFEGTRPGDFTLERQGGLTNLVYKLAFGDGRCFILRIPGQGTEAYIDRVVDLHNARVAAEAGVSAEVIYGDADSGLMLTRCIAGIVTISPAKLRERRSEEHTSELQSLMRLSYAVFCFKK